MNMSNNTNLGYHIQKIAKGTFGDPSKIVEETLEFEDAVKQEVTIMALVELADLYGAIEGYLTKHHPSITIKDLAAMSKVTKRVFENGHRKATRD